MTMPDISASTVRNKRIEKIFRARGSWDCHYCGRRLRPDVGPESIDLLTIDHIIPESLLIGTGLGGTMAAWNSVFACRQCNKRKADLSYEEFTGEALPEFVPWRSTEDARWAVRFATARRELERLNDPPPSLRRATPQHDRVVYSIGFDGEVRRDRSARP